VAGSIVLSFFVPKLKSGITAAELVLFRCWNVGIASFSLFVRLSEGVSLFWDHVVAIPYGGGGLYYTLDYQGHCPLLDLLSGVVMYIIR
jgi:hypothetical protein